MNTRRQRPFYTGAAGRRVALVAVFAILIGIIAWLALRDNNSTPSTQPTTATTSTTTTQTTSPVGPVLVSAAALKTTATLLGHKLYWAGALPGFDYELTVTTNGNVYVRYLPKGLKAGDKRANFLIVGTYPVANAYSVTGTAAKTSGNVSVTTKDGGLGFFSTNKPTNVYVAYPKVNDQIEVFDPSAARALSVAEKGLSSLP